MLICYRFGGVCWGFDYSDSVLRLLVVLVLCFGCFVFADLFAGYLLVLLAARYLGV